MNSGMFTAVLLNARRLRVEPVPGGGLALVPRNSILRVGMLSALLLALTPSTLFGQAVSGVLTGYVTDPSKTPVPGAAGTATEIRTGVTTKRTTDVSGLYIITNIPPGIYSISVEA